MKFFSYFYQSCIIIMIIGCKTYVFHNVYKKDSKFNFKIVRLHCTAKNKNPYVFGKVYRHELDNSQIPWPGASIIFDKDTTLISKADGHYAISLLSGKYNITGTYVGANAVRIKSLLLSSGDSVEVDFYLHDVSVSLH